MTSLANQQLKHSFSISSTKELSYQQLSYFQKDSLRGKIAVALGIRFLQLPLHSPPVQLSAIDLPLQLPLFCLGITVALMLHNSLLTSAPTQDKIFFTAAGFIISSDFL